jgi:hypothetical protein
MDPSQSASGSCLCGAVRFTARLPSLFCAHCHCSMCRRNHGAGYVTWFAVPRAALALDFGAEDLVRHASSGHGSRSFCRRCGSSLFCENTQYPDRVDIPLGAMSEPIDRAPQFHVFFDSRAPWVELGDALPRLGGKTGFEPLAHEPKPEPNER